MTKWKLVPVEPTPEMIDAWNNDDSDEFRHAYRAMLEAAPQPPKSEPVAYIEHGKDWAILVWDKPDGEYSALYTAPPAPSVPDGWRPFLTDVITAAGLLKHGKRDKGLAGRIGKFAFDAMRAAPTPAEPPTDLPTWENGDDPLVSGGLINRGVVDFATVGIWPTKPAPSVPVEPMENIALNEWLDKTEWVQKELNTFPVSSLGMHRADVMRIEIERLREMLAAPPAPSVPEVDPVAKVTGYYGGYLSISTIDGRVLPAGTALYLAPPAPSVLDGWKLVPYTPTDEMLEQAAYAVNSRPTPSKYETTATPAIIFWNAMLKYSPESTCLKEPTADVVRDAETLDFLQQKIDKGHANLEFGLWNASYGCKNVREELAAVIERDKLKGGA